VNPAARRGDTGAQVSRSFGFSADGAFWSLFLTSCAASSLIRARESANGFPEPWRRWVVNAQVRLRRLACILAGRYAHFVIF